jgi:hypothetical protein
MGGYCGWVAYRTGTETIKVAVIAETEDAYLLSNGDKYTREWYPAYHVEFIFIEELGGLHAKIPRWLLLDKEWL